MDILPDILFDSLFRHQAWADASLLSAVQAHPESLGNEWMLKTLHHIVFVQRYFLSCFLNRPFDRARESQPAVSFAELIALYRATHEEELAFVHALAPGDLERKFELPFLQTHFTVAEGLTQVVMHSQNHRGQCLTRLRETGARTPTLDYILWAKTRPAPGWPTA